MNQSSQDRLKPRSEPQQIRSIMRAQQILDVTAQLLERVGFDNLTTILITKELGISVGSLYHYFPSKHAILRALAEKWLSDWDRVLDEISQFPVENMELKDIVLKLTDTLLAVYQQQKGILPLVQAMYALPELRDLDEEHDKLTVFRMSALFKRIGLNQSKKEINRIADIYLELNHVLLVRVLEQKGVTARRTLDDLNATIFDLLHRYKL